jgi:recombination protein RecR
MIDKIPALAVLMRQLQQVPYLASKNMYRVVNYLLQIDAAKAEELCNAIREAKERIVHCPLCFCWKEKERPCSFCDNPQRDASLICVVETWHELMSIEKTSGYHGLYHVLGGALSPLEGIGPENLSIDNLVERVKSAKTGAAVKEIILATNQTPEGEATATYVASKLRPFNKTISCLARGVPVGASLEYIDRLTVYKALTERRPF